jgi:hypothetical protein
MLQLLAPYRVDIELNNPTSPRSMSVVAMESRSQSFPTNTSAPQFQSIT